MKKTFNWTAIVLALCLVAQPSFVLADSPLESKEILLQTQPRVQKVSQPSRQGALSKKNISAKNLEHPYVSGELIVKFNESRVNLKKVSGVVKASQFAARKNLSIRENIRRSNLTVLKNRGKESTEDAIERLEQDPAVKYERRMFSLIERFFRAA